VNVRGRDASHLRTDELLCAGRQPAGLRGRSGSAARAGLTPEEVARCQVLRALNFGEEVWATVLARTTEEEYEGANPDWVEFVEGNDSSPIIGAGLMREGRDRRAAFSYQKNALL
jgi:hypothetical protein